MRKKIMGVFYTLASVLILIHIGTRLNIMNSLQSSTKPLYIISQTSEPTAAEQQPIDYSKWGHKYDDKQQ
ncbi:hypothetical protein L4D76_16510 [Photobacterium sagamiensis]|uniref:hypothetical protein n=1 Tax=Photobacterium sagamiensis TaxID=2910241 RepID=UPI003D143B4B